MMGSILWRGMLAGILAAAVAFAFATIHGEPAIDGAIAFEQAHPDGHGEANDHGHDEVSRGIQKTVGLAIGLAATGVAFGGLFAIAFAVAHGRIGTTSARATAAVVALLGFVAVFLVPFLKYPANPPAVGDPSTIDRRTALYFLMIVFSVALTVAAVGSARRLAARIGAWNAVVGCALALLAAVSVVAWLMPSVNEIPEDFPADVLWRFRSAAVGVQVALWASIGLLFGALAQSWCDQRAPVA